MSYLLSCEVCLFLSLNQSIIGISDQFFCFYNLFSYALGIRQVNFVRGVPSLENSMGVFLAGDLGGRSLD